MMCVTLPHSLPHSAQALALSLNAFQPPEGHMQRTPPCALRVRAALQRVQSSLFAALFSPLLCTCLALTSHRSHSFFGTWSAILSSVQRARSIQARRGQCVCALAAQATVYCDTTHTATSLSLSPSITTLLSRTAALVLCLSCLVAPCSSALLLILRSSRRLPSLLIHPRSDQSHFVGGGTVVLSEPPTPAVSSPFARSDYTLWPDSDEAESSDLNG